MFGLTLPGVPVTCIEHADSARQPQLSPRSDPRQDPLSGWHRPYLDLFRDQDIAHAEISETGRLRWTRLLLASYMSDSPKSGRILLFNPVDDNRPLHELAERLESFLLSGEFPASYLPGVIDSSHLRWMDFRENLQRNVYKTEITRRQEKLQTTIKEEIIAVRTANIQEIQELTEQKHSLQAEVQRLQNLLDQGPTVIHIGTADHCDWLRDAIETSESTLIIISPWIRMHVLRIWLPSIEETLSRQCQVWIGHGMPTSAHYKENSDQSAFDALDELSYKTGLLQRVSNLNTHEKVLICDDNYIITTSYNWLSFTGGDRDYNRSEHGIVHAGSEVRALKEQFIRRLREHKNRTSSHN
jgi:hypothetical protein